MNELSGKTACAVIWVMQAKLNLNANVSENPNLAPIGWPAFYGYCGGSNLP